MTTNHYNQLTEAEAERLTILAEECSGVIKEICKIQRHGYQAVDPRNPDETNRETLSREIGDLLYSLDRMNKANDLNLLMIKVTANICAKYKTFYTHHQDV